MFKHELYSKLYEPLSILMLLNNFICFWNFYFVEGILVQGLLFIQNHSIIEF